MVAPLQVQQPFPLRIYSMKQEAKHIFSYDLRPIDEDQLPPFSAGSHIDLLIPNGLIRSYSILNDPVERHRYVVAVRKEETGTGGSKWMHEMASVGHLLKAYAPLNNFKLDESAPLSFLIAGGIGITPMLSMIARLSEIGRDWKLLYSAATRDEAAFVSLLEPLPNVLLNFTREPNGIRVDLQKIVLGEPSTTNFYCCGPASMITAFESATIGLPKEQVHVERFKPTSSSAPDQGQEFSVVLRRSGKRFKILPGESILSTLLAAGIHVDHSCTTGVCGRCETKIIEGVADHRDEILTESERKENKTMMICCSRAKSEILILDL